MKVTIEQIDGRPYTVIDHVETAFMPGEWRPMHDGSLTLRDANGHCATALPALPRHPKPDDAKLLHLYGAHGLRIFGTYVDLPAIDGQSNRCEFFPITGMVYCDYEERQADDAMLECDNIDFDFTITHTLHNGERVDIAIDGGE